MRTNRFRRRRRTAWSVVAADLGRRSPLREGLATVALDRAPIRELFAVASSRGREIGARVDPTLGPSGLIKAIHELAEHPETMLAMSNDAVGLIRDSFSAARMGADYAALHRELAARYST